MPIADREQVRHLSGNRSVDVVSDADIDTAINSSDAFVQAFTQNYNWTPADPNFNAIKEASEYLASHRIRSRFIDETDEAEEQKNWALEILKAVREHVGGAAIGGQVTIKSRAYRSNPLNPNVPYKRAIAYSDTSGDAPPFI